jgi:hypothetical protein
LFLDDARQKLPLTFERPAEVLPLAGERIRLDPRELEIVDTAEEPQRNVPAQLADQLVEQRLGRAAPGEPRVDG